MKLLTRSAFLMRGIQEEDPSHGVNLVVFFANKANLKHLCFTFYKQAVQWLRFLRHVSKMQ